MFSPQLRSGPSGGPPLEEDSRGFVIWDDQAGRPAGGAARARGGPREGATEAGADLRVIAPPAQAGQILGERLYALVQAEHQPLARKITDMLLDGLDTSELAALIDDSSALKGKINEALQSLARFNGAAFAGLDAARAAALRGLERLALLLDALGALEAGQAPPRWLVDAAQGSGAEPAHFRTFADPLYTPNTRTAVRLAGPDPAGTGAEGAVEAGAGIELDQGCMVVSRARGDTALALALGALPLDVELGEHQVRSAFCIRVSRASRAPPGRAEGGAAAAAPSDARGGAWFGVALMDGAEFEAIAGGHARGPDDRSAALSRSVLWEMDTDRCASHSRTAAAAAAAAACQVPSCMWRRRVPDCHSHTAGWLSREPLRNPASRSRLTPGSRLTKTPGRLFPQRAAGSAAWSSSQAERAPSRSARAPPWRQCLSAAVPRHPRQRPRPRSSPAPAS